MAEQKIKKAIFKTSKRTTKNAADKTLIQKRNEPARVARKKHVITKPSIKDGQKQQGTFFYLRSSFRRMTQYFKDMFEPYLEEADRNKTTSNILRLVTIFSDQLQPGLVNKLR